jgi:hypothetical protein
MPTIWFIVYLSKKIKLVIKGKHKKCEDACYVLYKIASEPM